MKIEKVNDHQIRCTLTKADLADRELKISELAYGTEKAKNLFRDMMQQASYEFGFDADDIPLMIEAIPLNSECIVLVITKVEDPEELDTRFSKFAPSVHDEEDDDDDIGNTLDSMLQSLSEGADDVLDLFKKIHDSHLAESVPDNAAGKRNAKIPANANLGVDLTRIYGFESLNQVTRLAHILIQFYNGKNSLYKNEKKPGYMLVVTQSDHTPEEFNKICNMLSEYGNPEKIAAASEAYMEEHFEPVIKDKAIQALSLV
ncbi:MAG: adaptor protein MecA [Lachnospiraceae bacterium]|jgi:adapter protein MecA 1/2|nr:adaptor protein MecA [Lachnospiraceae bacterium]